MHRKISLLVVTAALLGAGTLSACGGDDEASPAAASTPAQHESPSHERAKPAEKKKQRESATKPASAAAVKATISNFAFAPQAIEVEVGQEITWTNEDSAPHTVTATSGAEFDSGTMAQGATYTWKATTPGTIEYFCAIHPSMTGTITVK
jgi:plastocyanin